MKMTCYERILSAYKVEEGDRVPVALMNIYFVPYLAGLSVTEAFNNPDKLIQAQRKFIDLYGDMLHPGSGWLDHIGFLGKAGYDQATLDWRLYDDFPPEGNVPNLFEKDIIEDYDDVIERGFSTLLFNKKLENDIFGHSIDHFLYTEFEYRSVYAKAWGKFALEKDMPLFYGSRSCHPLDLLQYYRGMYNLVRDIYEQPEKVKEMCEWLAEYEAVRAMRDAMIFGAGEIPGAESILLFNGGPPGLSPGIFDEFYYPYAKKMVDMYVKNGFKVFNHWDTDLTAQLETISHLADGLPKGHILMDLEKTDMKKAKEILGDKMCIMGNVPSALLVYGTVSDVEDYCKQLIKDCAEGGGYILGAECEAPWDSKPENVRAMIQAAEKYGRY